MLARTCRIATVVFTVSALSIGAASCSRLWTRSLVLVLPADKADEAVRRITASVEAAGGARSPGERCDGMAQYCVTYRIADQISLIVEGQAYEGDILLDVILVGTNVGLGQGRGAVTRHEALRDDLIADLSPRHAIFCRDRECRELVEGAPEAPGLQPLARGI